MIQSLLQQTALLQNNTREPERRRFAYIDSMPVNKRKEDVMPTTLRAEAPVTATPDTTRDPLLEAVQEVAKILAPDGYSELRVILTPTAAKKLTINLTVLPIGTSP